MSVTRTNVSNAIETIIWDKVLTPVAYNVPMHESAQLWKLPRAGDVLKVPRGDEAAEATALDKNTVYTLANTTGSDDGTIYYDQYTIGEKGLFTNVNKWAELTTVLDVANHMGNRLINSAGRTMNSDSMSALIAQAGLQWLRVDGQTETRVEMEFTINSATGLLVTACRTDLTDIDDYWNNGQVTFITGPNRALSREISDFANSNGLLTFDAFPQVPTNGDRGYVCVIGNDTASGPADLSATDTITLAQILRARERCLRFGAGGLGMEGNQQNVVGIMRKRDGLLRQGMVFITTQVMHELQLTLYGNTTSGEPFYQTDKALQDALGGVLIQLGGLMFVPINHFKRIAVSDGVLSTTAGVGYPTIILFPNAFGCTVLKDNSGDRQGMDLVAKKIDPRSDAYMYKSLRYRGELDIINAYFCANSLHGAVLWSGTQVK